WPERTAGCAHRRANRSDDRRPARRAAPGRVAGAGRAASGAAGPGARADQTAGRPTRVLAAGAVRRGHPAGRLADRPAPRHVGGGESPAAGGAKKIGGAAIAGAILGGIMGGGKGAAIGSATGAAGGTAAVMAGDRTIVSMPSGQLMTAKLSAPATITVERRE